MCAVRRLCAVLVAGMLGLSAGCGSEGGALTDSVPAFDQKGHAAGGPVETIRFIDEFDFVIPADESCLSFAVGAVGRNKVIVQVYRDHLAIHNNYKSTLTNVATGFSLDDNGTWMDIVHLDSEGNAETVTTIGSIFRIVLRGRGIVSQDTGIITFDAETGEVFFEAGPHENANGLANTCDLLAGNA